MIVREIIKDCDKIINEFDWFNDYDDTLRYVRSQSHFDIVDRLEKGFELYLKKRNAEILKSLHK